MSGTDGQPQRLQRPRPGWPTHCIRFQKLQSHRYLRNKITFISGVSAFTDFLHAIYPFSDLKTSRASRGCRCPFADPFIHFRHLRAYDMRKKGEMKPIDVKLIGTVESPLIDLESAPRQADEDAPEAWLVFEPEILEGLRSIRPGDRVIVLTWLDRARRDVLSVHPRGDTSRALEGVFSTRSPHRPNPIGLHEVEITAVDGRRFRVKHLEVLDGTPIIDVKPILSADVSER